MILLENENLKTKAKSYYQVSKRLLMIILIYLSLLSCVDVEGIEKENIERIRSLNPNNVENIKIHIAMLQYKNQNQLLKQLDRRSDINSFIWSLRSLKNTRLDHPQYPNRWLVEIELFNKEKETLKIMQRTGYGNRLYVQCLGHSWLGSAAMAVSYDVHKWMENNIGLPKAKGN